MIIYIVFERDRYDNYVFSAYKNKKCAENYLKNKSHACIQECELEEKKD
jgi:hypothetical protein